MSTDPDEDPTVDQDLTYEWYCKQKFSKTEHIDLNNTDTVNEIDYPKMSMADDTNFKGCFGTGHGKLKEKGILVDE